MAAPGGHGDGHACCCDPSHEQGAATHPSVGKPSQLQVLPKQDCSKVPAWHLLRRQQFADQQLRVGSVAACRQRAQCWAARGGCFPKGGFGEDLCRFPGKGSPVMGTCQPGGPQPSAELVKRPWPVTLSPIKLEAERDTPRAANNLPDLSPPLPTHIPSGLPAPRIAHRMPETPEGSPKHSQWDSKAAFWDQPPMPFTDSREQRGRSAPLLCSVAQNCLGSVA